MARTDPGNLGLPRCVALAAWGRAASRVPWGQNSAATTQVLSKALLHMHDKSVYLLGTD